MFKRISCIPSVWCIQVLWRVQIERGQQTHSHANKVLGLWEFVKIGMDVALPEAFCHVISVKHITAPPAPLSGACECIHTLWSSVPLYVTLTIGPTLISLHGPQSVFCMCRHAGSAMPFCPHSQHHSWQSFNEVVGLILVRQGLISKTSAGSVTSDSTGIHSLFIHSSICTFRLSHTSQDVGYHPYWQVGSEGSQMRYEYVISTLSEQETVGWYLGRGNKSWKLCKGSPRNMNTMSLLPGSHLYIFIYIFHTMLFMKPVSKADQMDTNTSARETTADKRQRTRIGASIKMNSI